MITYDEAKEIAVREITSDGTLDNVIVEESTIEKPYGWVFSSTQSNSLKLEICYMLSLVMRQSL